MAVWKDSLAAGKVRILLQSMAIGGLIILLVASYCPNTHDRGDDEKGEELVGNALETATADKDSAYAIDKIVHRVDVGGEVCQLGHGASWGE